MDNTDNLQRFISSLHYASDEIGSSFSSLKKFIVVTLESPPPSEWKGSPESILIQISDVFGFDDLILHLFSRKNSPIFEFPFRRVLFIDERPALFLTKREDLRSISFSSDRTVGFFRLRFLQKRLNGEIKTNNHILRLLSDLRKDIEFYRSELSRELETNEIGKREMKIQKEKAEEESNALRDEIRILRMEKEKIEEELFRIFRSPGYKILSGIGGLLKRNERK